MQFEDAKTAAGSWKMKASSALKFRIAEEVLTLADSTSKERMGLF